MIVLAQVDAFFNKYKKLNEELLTQRFTLIADQFSSFKRKYTVLSGEIQSILIKRSPYYNVFDILNIRHYETKVHTPFLCHLLNPKANHEQGRLFLDRFFKDVLDLESQIGHLESYEIYEELNSSFGRIDIIIKYKINGISKAVVLENKIYATDQPKQLERYYNYLAHNLNISNENMLLVYLSPYSSNPSDYSINEELAKKLRSEKVLVNIGYYEHIIPWLTTSMDDIQSDKVRFTIDQYIKTLRTL